MKEITNSRSGNYLITNLALPKQEDVTIGKYGILRHTYLKTYKRGLYAKLLLSENLQTHLAEVDLQAEKMVQEIVEQTSQKGYCRIRQKGS